MAASPSRTTRWGGAGLYHAAETPLLADLHSTPLSISPQRDLACRASPCPTARPLSAQDKETRLQWWKLLMCDPASSIMSVREKEERGNGTVSKTDWPKYRNMRVRCAKLGID